jgi:alpha-galactosidase
VLLDKDGSPMLNPVGLVDTGRVSADSGHSFEITKSAEPGIAARFYMHRNFFVNDPDAFMVTNKYVVEGEDTQPSLSLGAAQASIALSAVSGGMFEIGDDMLVLGSEKERMALVENRDLLNMAKVGRVHTPVDLMSYEPEDEQPSVFFLRQSNRQSMLTVFNWTNSARSHTLKLADLGLPAGHTFVATDVFATEKEAAAVALDGDTVRIENQAPQSVRMIKITDRSIAGAAPTITAKVPSAATAGETIIFSAQSRADGVPAVEYHWSFGDGTSTDGPKAAHAYTRAGDFEARLTVDGVDGVPAQQAFSIKITGNLRATPQLTDNRRFVEPTER